MRLIGFNKGLTNELKRYRIGEPGANHERIMLANIIPTRPERIKSIKSKNAKANGIRIEKVAEFMKASSSIFTNITK